MPRRVLVCLEDTGVAHVIAARLSADGVDGVVVEHARELVALAKDGGASAIALQDRYRSGEIGSSLLRQVRLQNDNEAIPALVVVTGELQPPDRHVLERQYRVHQFLEKNASPHQIAEGLLTAAAPADGSEEPPLSGEDLSDESMDLELHPDESKNEFDVDIAGEFEDNSDDEVDEDLDPVNMTMEYQVPVKDLEAMREMPPPVPPDDTSDTGNTLVQAALSPDELLDSDEPTGEIEIPMMSASAVESGQTLVLDLPSELPAPGGDDDFSLPSEAPLPDATELSSAAVDPPVRAERPLDETTPVPPPISKGQLPDRGKAPLANEDLTTPGRPTPAVDATRVDDGDEDVLDLIDRISEESGETNNVTPDAAKTDKTTKRTAPRRGPAPESENSISRSEGEAMQMNELKKALLASKRKLENASKRIEELEEEVTRVRGPAMAGSDDGLPEEGVFEEMRYPMLLSRCRFDAFTGTIDMPTEGATRTVFIKDGLPVGYQSSEPGERIGKMLVSQGRISDDDYVKAATRMVERGIKLTDALVELGLIEAEALSIELRNLTKDQIISGFSLIQGRFSLKKDVAPDDSVPTFDFGPGEIYVQGYRQYAPKVEMQALFEQLRNKYLIANARLASFRPKLGLGGDDERLLRLLGEAYTLEEAVERASVGEEDAARLIASLQVLDLVEEWSPGVEQFQARLRSERQHFAEELAKIQDEASKREGRLFEGFERALAKITSSIGSGPTSLSENLDAGALPPPSKAVLPAAPVPAPAEPAPAAEPPPDEPMSTDSASGDAKMPAAPGPDEPLSPADQKYREGVQLATENRLDEAEATLRESVRLDPAKSEYLTSLARVLLSNPRYERAGTLPVVRSLLDRAVQLSPTDTEAKELHDQVIGEMA